MKKVLFAAIAVCGTLLASAQGATFDPFNTESSSKESKAGPVTSDFNLKLHVHNIIRIFPNENLNMYAIFDKSKDLDGEKYLNLGLADMFWVSSNRPFKATMTAGTLKVENAIAGGNSSMPYNVFSYKPVTENTGLTLAVSDWTPLAASQNLITKGLAGKDRKFGIHFKANPGWDYTGGDYTVPITVTATQD